MINLINTAELKKMIEAGESLSVKAKPVSEGIGSGYFLFVIGHEKEWVLSTWRSTSPRNFIKADPLLRCAKDFGFSSVVFDI
jgi:hypothetical protein